LWPSTVRSVIGFGAGDVMLKKEDQREKREISKTKKEETI